MFNSFRFFDNREKYLLFVNTCNEKQLIADRIAMDVRHLQPVPPALRIFDAGMGDATVLTRVMRYLHHRFPAVPFLIVAKETSSEDVRIGLEKMPERFQEHPQTVLALTNMFYSEAPALFPRSPSAQSRLQWLKVELEGDSAFEFGQQITELEPTIQDWWETAHSATTGNPRYVDPSVLVIYRKDQKWPLGAVVPQAGDPDHEYDLVIAAQSYRARSAVSSKVKTVLGPLARSLSPSGVMVVIQSTGKDPGMEIVRRLWPGEAPFQTPRHELLKELRVQLEATRPQLRYLSYPDSRAEFRYFLQVPPHELNNNIGTSTVLAAWNAAAYVAQIEDQRLHQAMGRREYLDVTLEVLEKYEGLWFIDESFVVSRVANQ